MEVAGGDLDQIVRRIEEKDLDAGASSTNQRRELGWWNWLHSHRRSSACAPMTRWHKFELAASFIRQVVFC